MYWHWATGYSVGPNFAFEGPNPVLGAQFSLRGAQFSFRGVRCSFRGTKLGLGGAQFCVERANVMSATLKSVTFYTFSHHYVCHEVNYFNTLLSID